MEITDVKHLTNETMKYMKSLDTDNQQNLFDIIMDSDIFSMDYLHVNYRGYNHILNSEIKRYKYKELLFNLLTRLSNKEIITVLYEKYYQKRGLTENTRYFFKKMFNDILFSRHFFLSDFEGFETNMIQEYPKFGLYISCEENELPELIRLMNRINREYNNILLGNVVSNHLLELSRHFHTQHDRYYYKNNDGYLSDFLYKYTVIDQSENADYKQSEKLVDFLNENPNIKEVLDKQLISINISGNSNKLDTIKSTRGVTYNAYKTDFIADLFEGNEEYIELFYGTSEVLDNHLARIKSSEVVNGLSSLEQELLDYTSYDKPKMTMTTLIENIKSLIRKEHKPPVILFKHTTFNDNFYKIIKKSELYTDDELKFIIKNSLYMTGNRLSDSRHNVNILDVVYELSSQEFYNEVFLDNIEMLSVPKINFKSVKGYIYVSTELKITESFALDNGFYKLQI